MTDEPQGLLGRLLHKKFTRREMLVNAGTGAAGIAAGAVIGPKLLETLAPTPAIGRPALGPIPEVASVNLMLRDFGLVLKGLSANPPLEEGMFYYRTDRGEYRGSVDGLTTKTFLHELQIDGVPTAQRSILNIIGGDALEDPVNKRINVTFPPSQDTKVIVLAGGVAIGAAAHHLNFSNANDVTGAEDAPGNKVDIAIRRNVANGIAGLSASGQIAAPQHGAEILGDLNSPATLVSNQNDYDIGTAALIRLMSDAQRTITGILASTYSKFVVLRNVGSNNIILANQNIGSALANRIITGIGADMVLPPGQGAVLCYDLTSARWQIAG